jgi:predicted glycosyltransferase
VALADLVISAGGTMNREAVSLGVPAYTTFAGHLGAVDELLIADGRLRVLTSPESVTLEKRSRLPARVERDPALFLDLLLSALEP